MLECGAEQAGPRERLSLLVAERRLEIDGHGQARRRASVHTFGRVSVTRGCPPQQDNGQVPSEAASPLGASARRCPYRPLPLQAAARTGRCPYMPLPLPQGSVLTWFVPTGFQGWAARLRGSKAAWAGGRSAAALLRRPEGHGVQDCEPSAAQP